MAWKIFEMQAKKICFCFALLCGKIGLNGDTVILYNLYNGCFKFFLHTLIDCSILNVMKYEV